MQLKKLALASLMTLPVAGLTLGGPATVSPTASTEGGSAHPAKTKLQKVKMKKPKTAKKEHWVCPMHDGGESDHAGKCSKCGMDLVKEEPAQGAQ